MTSFRCLQSTSVSEIYVSTPVLLSSVYNRPYSRCQSLKPSLVFSNRASYGRWRNNDVTSQEREVTMMLRHDLRTDAHICGKFASQPSLFVHHGRGVNRVYCVVLSVQQLYNLTKCEPWSIVTEAVDSHGFDI